MPVNKRIPNGTNMRWVSRGVEKTGIIQAFVPAFIDVKKLWDELHPNKEFDWGCIGSVSSSIPRYLIKVQIEKKTYTYHTHYCPSASVIERQNPEALSDEANL
jgi:hypothetical protein